MQSSKPFPDQHHLEVIKKSLWSGKHYGKAAVMVGAGFSMNAEARLADARQFPTWNQLASLIFDQLYPPGTVQDEDLKTPRPIAAAGLGALRLASEYEATFGRQKLDDLLMELIPYDEYAPGHLHNLLMSLPWSDVYTTNYDSLLEAARESVIERKYDLILTFRDVPQTKKPRLVKLHGTFPSHRPFIITEEDYRTYPAKFAPFVNLVQQAMVENVFCLIGFSGDDPNFLNWLGWVRDNLKEHAPKLYLCGLLDLSSSQRRLLECRNVIPVDLSPLFPKDEWPDVGLRYAKALEWFLIELGKGKPPYRLDWPREPESSESVESVDHSAPRNKGKDKGVGIDLTGPREPLNNEKLSRLLEIWKKQRLAYPGWVVCPRENRSVLWSLTRNWIHAVTEAVDGLELPKNLLMLRELNWRLDKALVPLPGIEDTISRVVTLFNPFPTLVQMPGSPISPNNARYPETTWDEISEAWLELIFALMRNAREDGDQETFMKWVELLRPLVPRKPRWQIRYWQEHCLFHIGHLNWKTVVEDLNNWPSSSFSPIDDIRRSAILAEIGQNEQAHRIVRDSLLKIRRSISADQNDCSLMSQEGWGMLLEAQIAANRGGKFPPLPDPYHGRWGELAAFRCNPRTDLQITTSELERDRPVSPPEKEERLIEGRTVATYHIAAPSQWELCLPAMAFLRQFEDGGQPVSCGIFAISSEAVANAAKWMFVLSPIQSVMFLVRSGNPKAVRDWFDRLRAATLSEETVCKLLSIFMDFLKASVNRFLATGNQAGQATSAFAMRVTLPVLHILSELCFRLSIEDRATVFDLTVEVCKDPAFPSRYWLRDSVGKLLRSLLDSMPSREILDRMNILLDFPIPDASTTGEAFPRGWVEPFQFLTWEPNTQVAPSADLSTWQNSIRNLLRVAESGTSFPRTQAVQRLERLREIGALTPDQIVALGDALWSRIDPRSGLPSDTLFLSHAFLTLSEPVPGRAKETFRKKLLTLDFPRLLVADDKSTGWSVGGKTVRENWIIPELREATARLLPLDEESNQRLVDWTEEETLQLLTKSASWWDENKTDLQDPLVVNEPSIQDRFRGELSQIVSMFTEIVLPRLPKLATDSKDVALRVLAEMEHEGFSTSLAEPMTLYANPDRYEQVSRKMRFGLLASDANEVSNCIHGIFIWILHGSKGAIAGPPEDLSIELANIVIARRQPGLITALDKVCTILRRMPQTFRQDQILALCVSLEYLKTETELPTDPEAFRRFAAHPTIALEDRPSCRERSARLAYAIHSHLKRNNLETPPVLSEWEQICRVDPFPEVRSAWPE